jgi:hypothetical protein
MSATPEIESLAAKDRVQFELVVNRCPPLIAMLPVGPVVSKYT